MQFIFVLGQNKNYSKRKKLLFVLSLKWDASKILLVAGRVVAAVAELLRHGREREKARNGRFLAISRRESVTQSGLIENYIRGEVGCFHFEIRGSLTIFQAILFFRQAGFIKTYIYLCCNRPRRHEGYMHKRRKWPLKGWTKRWFDLSQFLSMHQNISFVWILFVKCSISLLDTFLHLQNNLCLKGTFCWKEGASHMESLRWLNFHSLSSVQKKVAV